MPISKSDPWDASRGLAWIKQNPGLACPVQKDPLRNPGFPGLRYTSWTWRADPVQILSKPLSHLTTGRSPSPDGARPSAAPPPWRGCVCSFWRKNNHPSARIPHDPGPRHGSSRRPRCCRPVSASAQTCALRSCACPAGSSSTQSGIDSVRPGFPNAAGYGSAGGRQDAAD